MKFKLAMCSLVLGSCMALVAQQNPASSQQPQELPPPAATQQQQTPGAAQPAPGMPPEVATPSQSPTSEQSGMSQTASQAGQVTVQGCVSGSENNYTLAERSGKSIELKGDTSQLAQYVGKEVQITGTAAESMAASSTGEAAEAGAKGEAGEHAAAGSVPSSLTVSSVQKIADTCKSPQ